MGVYYHTNGNIFTGQWVSCCICWFFLLCHCIRAIFVFCIFVFLYFFVLQWERKRSIFTVRANIPAHFSLFALHRLTVNPSLLFSLFQANNMRNGKGTYVFVNGSKYTGHWLNNNIHLKGRFDFANGAFYRGTLQMSFLCCLLLKTTSLMSAMMLFALYFLVQFNLIFTFMQVNLTRIKKKDGASTPGPPAMCTKDNFSKKSYVEKVKWPMERDTGTRDLNCLNCHYIALVFCSHTK